MSAHMKGRPIRHELKKKAKRLTFLSENNDWYELPASLIEKYKSYRITSTKKIEKARDKFNENRLYTPDEAFAEIEKKYTPAGASLKGLRYREGMNQLQFAASIGVKQGDLSKMENGKRPIGKLLAKRIAKKYKVSSYKFFL